MARLFGETMSRGDLLARTGNISQLGGVTAAELSDGFERGVRIANVRTGSGFDFTVLVDRGLDIGPAAYCGTPLAWRSPTTAVAPAFFEPDGLGWLRGFQGGLLTTCGLTYFGAPGLDEGIPLGLHGRASYLPATQFTYGGAWRGDDYDLWVSGQTRESSVFGANLVLRRRIGCRLGEAQFVVEDSVTNEGYEPTPHMLLYHINLGFPVVAEGSELLTSPGRVVPRDEDAAKGLGRQNSFEPPTPGYKEQVFYHELSADQEGYVLAAIVNRGFCGGRGLGVYVRFRKAELPWLVQWKMMGQGHYVCAIEPATNLVGGRALERSEGRLLTLQPGATRRYHLEIGILASRADIEALDGVPAAQST